MKLKILFMAMSLGVIGGASAIAGCDTSDATFSVIDNRYPAPPDGGDPATQTAIYQGWWSVTLFTTPVAAGAESDPERAITSTETAYALLAPGWNPSSGAPPAKLIPVMSPQELHVARGDTLHIVVSDDTMIGNCAAGKPLTQDQADFITGSIFPGPFAGMIYDAATCITRPIPSVDAGTEAGD
jgi:hypothetical protein